MPWTQSDVDWFAVRLWPAIHDLNQRARYERNTRRLEALYDELTKPMKIRITEQTFFDGRNLHPGDVINAQVVNGVTIGPFRTEATGGGLRKINQFTEMAEEITTPQPAPVQTAPPAASFAEATATVLKPVAPAKPASGPTPATLLAGLTSRRNKLNDTIASNVTSYAAKLTQVEASLPDVFKKANARLDDEIANLSDLDKSVTDFALANGGDPLGS